MKRFVQLVLLLLFAGWQNTAVQAQPASSIETLNIDFWPDYDRSAVLILLTGTLPAPGTVTIPLSPEADINAVARIEPDGSLISVEHEIGNQSVTFNNSTMGFRVEYYIPYTSEGNRHNFSYTWLAEVPVQQLSMVVQEPAAATEMVLDPEPVSVNEGNDGLTYYTLGTETVPAGQPATVQAIYTMADEQLTAPAAANPAPAPPPPAEIESEGSGLSLLTEGDPNWPLILGIIGVLLIVIAGVWQLSSRRISNRPRKPKPRRTRSASPPLQKKNKSRSKKANFCHNCGEPITPGDKFCRNCGTRLKG